MARFFQREWDHISAEFIHSEDFVRFLNSMMQGHERTSQE